MVEQVVKHFGSNILLASKDSDEVKVQVMHDDSFIDMIDQAEDELGPNR